MNPLNRDVVSAGLGLNDRASDIWRPLFAITAALHEGDLSAQLRGLPQEMSPDPRQGQRRPRPAKRETTLIRVPETAADFRRPFFLGRYRYMREQRPCVSDFL
jgi:hypothetical protein